MNLVIHSLDLVSEQMNMTTKRKMVIGCMNLVIETIELGILSKNQIIKNLDMVT